MSLEELNQRVARDLSYIAYGGVDWVQPQRSGENRIYDVVIVGGGQSGLGTAFGLLKERIANILVLDENPAGMEGPWETYARMVTLRTPKHLTSIDLGIPSLTFRSWWESQHGAESWEAIGKIPRSDWMSYLRWYRAVLALPVVNETRLTLIEPLGGGVHKLHLEGAGAPASFILSRKVILATGIQGGGEWHVPSMVSERLPRSRYAHTSEPIDFAQLAGKRIAVLGGGASAFDNAHHALAQGVAEAHVFVRRSEMPRINPIRQMEFSGMIEHFHLLPDEDKYEVMAHFFRHSQPPTNDTYERACALPGFQLHLGSPWLQLEEADGQVEVTTPQGRMSFDYLIVSTGLLTDPALRPELKLVEHHIARWKDIYEPPEPIASPVLDAHPYLAPGFSFTSRSEEGENALHGLFTFNYSAMISCGLSASALSGMRYAIPKLVSGVSNQLFLDDKRAILESYYAYDEMEFVGQWPPLASSE